ncbi:choice-of-anchor L domain-containing protein [Chryseobacterium wangxinyae]|uniref:choice-of-anchor L domain-containing protein n=1 Tax=Chryseobacterium sp. CY350 TaxID=2997336 RepID=UPI00227689D9|nr:choice-of-anchor L domain-containing protein [Chryseobacterium sp. CY350]MCY0977561.1 choice-of-anchor L domain-containing protein [Chryseobacterium sp. CY350]WBZ95429.1 choice-of-anchor L domain-containing protein [Chryseobacterium sp. CY350]
MLNYRLKNYFRLSFILLFCFSIFSYAQKNRPPAKKTIPLNAKAGAYIDVNVAPYPQTNFTATQLVTDVLVGSSAGCGTPNISNVTVSPNQLVTNNDRFWGYFNKTTSAFPFDEGIVLTTGFARKAGNIAETGILSDGNGGGSDADLIAAIGVTTQINNAAVLEFDFVPTSSQMKFRYIFASEEYTGSFPCPPTQYDDAFALLLKPNTPGSTYTNLAVLPGGAGPVSVPNILPSSFACGPINAQYFGSLAPNATNYNGTTAPLTAEATVIPGQSYHIKMVVADARDSSYGSAVFLEAGSFDIGISIVDSAGNLIPSVLNVCDNVPQVLNAQVVATPGMTFQWFKDDVAIAGATNISYTATSPGVYSVKVTIPGGNCPGEAKVTIVGGTTPTAQNATLKLCTTPSTLNFDLNLAKPSISTTPGAIFRFYVNQADAIAQNGSFIAAPESFNGNDGQVLHVVVSNGAFCSKLVTLTLNKEATPIAALAATKLKICSGESVTLTASGGVTYQWNNFTGTGAVRTVSPTQNTTYTVYAIGAQGCKSLQPATVIVEVVPAITSNLSGGFICLGDRITLDAGTGPNYTYQWNNGETSQTVAAELPGLYSVTISNGVCSKVYSTQVILAIIPQIIKVDYDENGTLVVTASNPSNGQLEYSNDNGVTWQSSNVFTNVANNTLVPIRVKVKNTSCVGFLEYFTFIMKNVITPNGDNVNDMIDFRGISDLKDFQAVISDRYGKAVFKAEKTRPFWDGFFQGKKLPTSSYWYQVTFEDPATKKLTVKTGWILLKNFE